MKKQFAAKEPKPFKSYAQQNPPRQPLHPEQFRPVHPMTVTSMAERLSHTEGKLGIVFAVVTAVTMSTMALKTIKEIFVGQNHHRGHRDR